MFQPKVSIIIPVYNGANYMRNAIDSALGQTYSNCEVIVVNDGSDDNGETDLIAKSYGNRIRYFTKPNGGVASALNLGIEKIEGEYFSWLSHDDYYLPDKVKHQIEILSELPHDTILYSGYILEYIKDKTKILVDFAKQYAEEDLAKPLFPVFRGLANGCTVMFHKDLLLQSGIFNTTLPTTQDYDLWFRLFRNAKIHYCNTCDVVMRQHEEQGSKKILTHAAEASRLWIGFDEKLFDYERAALFGTPNRYYKTTSEFLKESPYMDASVYYTDKANTYYYNQDESLEMKNKLIETLLTNAEKSNDGSSKNSISLPVKADRLTNRLRLAVHDLGLMGTIKKCFRTLDNRIRG